MNKNARLQRRHARLKVFQPTMVRIDSVEDRAHLLNLSVAGALVHHPAPPEVGATVEIGCFGTMRPGRVRWTRGRHFGVQFRSPLGEAELAAAVSAREALIAVEKRRIGSIR